MDWCGWCYRTLCSNIIQRYGSCRLGNNNILILCGRVPISIIIGPGYNSCAALVSNRQRRIVCTCDTSRTVICSRWRRLVKLQSTRLTHLSSLLHQQLDRLCLPPSPSLFRKNQLPRRCSPNHLHPECNKW